MFEERKDKAKTTMNKKEKCIDEITVLLHQEIMSKLNWMREEKRSFLQWQKACSELERVGRLLCAWEWTEGRDCVVRREADIGKKEQDVARVKKEKERHDKELLNVEEECEEVKAKRDEVAELEKASVKMRTQADIKKATIEEEKKCASLVRR